MRTQTALLIAMIVTSTAAYAAEKHVYLGAGVGEKVTLAGDDAGLGVAAEDRALKLFGGLVFGDHFGVELTSYDFGTQTCCGPGVADLGFDIDLDGYSAAFVARLPMRRLDLFCKLGYLFWDEDGQLTTIAGPESHSADGSDLMAGAGIAFHLTDHLGVRLEWEYFQFDEIGPAAGDEDVDMFSAGIQYRF